VHLVRDRSRRGQEAEVIVAPRPVPAPDRALAHMIAIAAKVPVFALEAAVSLTASAQSLAGPMTAMQEEIAAGMIGAIAVPIVGMTMVAMNMITSAARRRVLVRLSRRGGTGERTTKAKCGTVSNSSRARGCIIRFLCFIGLYCLLCVWYIFDMIAWVHKTADTR